MKFTLEHADQKAIQLAALKWSKRSMSCHGGQHLGLTFRNGYGYIWVDVDADGVH